MLHGRYYASGLLTSPLVSRWDGSGATLLSYATWPAYTSLLLLHAALAHSRLHGWLRRKHETAPGGWRQQGRHTLRIVHQIGGAQGGAGAGLVAGIQEPGKAARQEEAPEGHGTCVSREFLGDLKQSTNALCYLKLGKGSHECEWQGTFVLSTPRQLLVRLQPVGLHDLLWFM